MLSGSMVERNKGEKKTRVFGQTTLSMMPSRVNKREKAL